jgi:two-component system, OmpR family, catabolic regulation response regulator CreB
VDTPGHTVLVVDDDPSIRLLCRVNLELEGCEVREAGSLDQARVELGRGDVDLVLLDVHVGSRDGAELLVELRRDHPGLPVAMLTGSADHVALERSEADAVLFKPFTLEQLTGTVRLLTARAAGMAG